MLTIIGTGHVFQIGESVSFLTRQCWPDAVCVELDEMRFHALTGDREALKKDMAVRGIDSAVPAGERSKNESPVFRQSARYQEKTAGKNNSSAGADMVAAIGAAKSVDAPVYCIDTDARETMSRMWDEMSGAERLRYKMSGIKDNLFGTKRVDKTQKEYSRNQEAYVEDMRRRYPTMIRVLVDERNAHMSEKITEICSKHKNVVAVVGDAHVDGLLKLLPSDLEIRTVRLVELMDPVRLKNLKTEYWESM